MITEYNTIRSKYIVDGYEEALAYIEELENLHKLPEQVLTNFYCYIIIQAEFKAEEVLKLLTECLEEKESSQSVDALTLYHIASVYFKLNNYALCMGTCQKILHQYLGLYYSLEMRLEKNSDQVCLVNDLQEIIYYVFLMLAYVTRSQDQIQTTSFLDAAKRIMKDRKNVYSLTTKTNSNQSSNNSFGTVNGEEGGKKIERKSNDGEFGKQKNPLRTC